jgi:dTDP-4-dehydrorhamnose reductase
MSGVLVTGGSGYLGAELLRQLAQAPWPIVATYHSHLPDQLPGNASCIAVDLRQPGSAARLISEVRPQFVIHTAYVQNEPGLQAITVDGAAEVAQAAYGVGARLIHMSSDAIFDGLKSTPYTEDDPPSPVSVYGRAKAEAERRGAEAHPGALLVRTSLIYGGQELSKHEQLVIDAAQGRADIAFFTDEVRCPVLVGELASALIELLETPQRGPLHVAGPEAVSRYTFARLVAAAHGADPQRLRSARSADSPLPRPRNCALDTQRARSLLRTRLRGPSDVLS